MDTLGWIHYQRGDYDKAADVLEQVVAATDTLPVADYHLGMAYLRQVRADQARTHLRRALASGQAFTGAAEAAQALKSLPPGSSND